MVWVWVTVAFMVINFGSLLVPDSDAITLIMRVVGLGLLIGWYFTQGRPQVRHVKESLGNNYIKKSLGIPLLIGVTAVGALSAGLSRAFSGNRLAMSATKASYGR